ncbi:hypothetical protein PMIN02_003886 [Paraphaeosphaeria minitans]
MIASAPTEMPAPRPAAAAVGNPPPDSSALPVEFSELEEPASSVAPEDVIVAKVVRILPVYESVGKSVYFIHVEIVDGNVEIGIPRAPHSLSIMYMYAGPLVSNGGGTGFATLPVGQADASKKDDVVLDGSGASVINTGGSNVTSVSTCVEVCSTVVEGHELPDSEHHEGGGLAPRTWKVTSSPCTIVPATANNKTLVKAIVQTERQPREQSEGEQTRRHAAKW